MHQTTGMIFGPDGTRIGQAVADDVSGMSSGEGGWLFAMADDLMKQAYRSGAPITSIRVANIQTLLM